MGQDRFLETRGGITLLIDPLRRVLFPRPGIDPPSPGLSGDMALVGRLHPLLIHFPIALVLSPWSPRPSRC